MAAIHFGLFHKTLYYYLEASLKDAEGIYNSGDFTYRLFTLAGYDEGDKKSIKSLSSKYTNERTIPIEVLQTFTTPRGKRDAVEGMKYLVANIIGGTRDRLIRDFCTLINTDTEMDQDYREYLFSLANKESLPEFLTEILIYSMTGDPSQGDKRLLKVAGPSLSLITEKAVPEVVKTILTLQFVGYDENPEALQALSENRFLDFAEIMIEERRMTAKEFYQFKNTMKIAGMTDEELRVLAEEHGDECVSDEFDIDWYIRFFEGAGNVSQEDMQRLWAKMLAGEIRKPGSISLRALRTIADMSAREAYALEAASRVILQDVTPHGKGQVFIAEFPQMSPNININYGVDAFMVYDDLVQAGVIAPAEDEEFYLASADSLLSSTLLLTNMNGEYVLRIVGKENQPYKIPYRKYRITQMGSEILSIMDMPDDDYLQLLGASFYKSFGENYDVGVYAVTAFDYNLRIYGETAKESDYLDLEQNLIEEYPLMDKLHEKFTEYFDCN